MSRISDPQDSQSESLSQPNAGAGKVILLAEDDPFISRMYQTKLESAGFNVHLFNNGRDVYENIKTVNPDLVLLDINMPELTGFEVVKALQADGADDLISKIIILTNSANPKDRQLASDLNIDYVVKAEMTPHDVLDMINKKLAI